jgi:hypothetical protein
MNGQKCFPELFGTFEDCASSHMDISFDNEFIKLVSCPPPSKRPFQYFCSRILVF